jgi:hydrogenase-4 component B
VRPARLHVRLRDVLWETLYLPLSQVVAYGADRLNGLQFLTIRGYLTLVFGALVALLMVLSVWQ